MALQPSFAVTPRIAAVPLSSADTSYIAPGATTIITGASTGTRIAEVVVIMTNTVASATMVRLFLNDGTSSLLFDEVAIPAATGSQSVKQTRVSTLYTNLVLPNSSWSLRATVHTANSCVVIALGADL